MDANGEQRHRKAAQIPKDNCTVLRAGPPPDPNPPRPWSHFMFTHLISTCQGGIYQGLGQRVITPWDPFDNIMLTDGKQQVKVLSTQQHHSRMERTRRNCPLDYDITVVLWVRLWIHTEEGSHGRAVPLGKGGLHTTSLSSKWQSPARAQGRHIPLSVQLLTGASQCWTITLLHPMLRPEAKA